LFANYFVEEKKQLTVEELYNITFPNEVEETKINFKKNN
jgi:hypothetical protein